MPVVIPGEGEIGISKRHVSSAKIRDTLGDLSIYSTFAKSGRGSPRLSIAMGYFGEWLLAGQDRNHANYSTLALAHTPTAQRYLQKINLAGKVDRVDVYAANVGDIGALIYESNGGIPGNLLAVEHLATPRYGLSASPAFYWFPITFNNLNLNGEYFIEVRGNLTLRAFNSPLDIVDEAGVIIPVVGNGKGLSIRAIEMIGGLYVSDEIKTCWASFTPLGDVTW
jgi:hypothetical protein